MERTTDFDLMLASQVAGDSAMFQLLGGKPESKADVVPALIDALERMIAVCPGQGPTKEIALAAIERAKRR